MRFRGSTIPRLPNLAMRRQGYEDYQGSRGEGGPASLNLDYLAGWHAARDAERRLDEELPETELCPKCKGEAPSDCDHCGGSGNVEV